MSKMRKSSSSRAHRVRTAWFPVVLSVENGVREIHLCWKFADGSIGLYSSSSKTSKSRPAWDYIRDCVFKRTRNERGEEHDYFILQNRGMEKKAFRIDELNPVLWAVNEFTSKFIEMRANNQEKLLAMYLALLSKSSNFCCNVEGTHDDYGFRLDDSNITVQDLERESGSLQSYTEFIEKANQCCLDVLHKKDVLEKVEGGKSKKAGEDEAGPPKVKRSKVEKVQDDKEEELAAKDGVEKNYIGQYLGRSDVPLHNLTVSSKVSLPIIPWKVLGLVKAMTERFDPSQISLTAVPVGSGVLTADNLSASKYEIIHGRHRLLALMELEKKGLLTSLRGMENKLVTCHIVRADCAIQANYGAIRGNDCQSEFVRKPFVHELVFILEGLTNQFGKDKAIEAVSRYGKSLAFGHDEMTAVRKIGAWPIECLSSLAKILKMFQTLQTEDAKIIAKRQSTKIMNGSIISVPNILLKNLSKVDHDYFNEKAHLVIEKIISLKQLVDNFYKTEARRQTIMCVKEISGFRSVEELSEVYPYKFVDEVMDSFEGAVIGERSNIKGEALQEYCRNVFENKEMEPKAKFKELTSFSDIDLSELTGYELVILNCYKLENETFLQIQTIKGLNTSVSIILLFGENKEGINAYNQFSSDQGMFDPKLIFFTVDKAAITGGFCGNVKLGILLAGVIFKPPIMALNGDLTQLEDMVNKLVPPDSRVAYLCEGSENIVKVHSEISCDYFGSKVVLEKFKKVLKSDMSIDLTVPGLTDINNTDVDKSEQNSNTQASVIDTPGPSGICNSTFNDGVKDPGNYSLNVSEISGSFNSSEKFQSIDESLGPSFED